MNALTITSRGQITFRRELLQHLGLRPGEKVEVEKMPDGRVALRAARPAGTIGTFIGVLKGKTKKRATIEEINEAAAAGWADRK